MSERESNAQHGGMNNRSTEILEPSNEGCETMSFQRHVGTIEVSYFECPVCKCLARRLKSVTYAIIDFKRCQYCGWFSEPAVKDFNNDCKQGWELEIFEMSIPLGQCHLKTTNDPWITQPIRSQEQEEHFRDNVRQNIANVEGAFISKFIDNKIVRENLLSGEIAMFSPWNLRNLPTSFLNLMVY